MKGDIAKQGQQTVSIISSTCNVRFELYLLTTIS